MFLWRNRKNLSQNYHQILPLNKSSVISSVIGWEYKMYQIITAYHRGLVMEEYLMIFWDIVVLFSIKKKKKKTYVVGTHQKRLSEALLTSTHSICYLLYREIGELSQNFYQILLLNKSSVITTLGVNTKHIRVHICKTSAQCDRMYYHNYHCISVYYRRQQKTM